MKITSKDKWFVAINVEQNALDANGVWRLVALPKASHVLRNK